MKLLFANQPVSLSHPQNFKNSPKIEKGNSLDFFVFTTKIVCFFTLKQKEGILGDMQLAPSINLSPVSIGNKSAPGLVRTVEISEENQIELSRLECKEYLNYVVKLMKIDELNIRVDSTQSDFLQRSLEAHWIV